MPRGVAGLAALEIRTTLATGARAGAEGQLESIRFEEWQTARRHVAFSTNAADGMARRRATRALALTASARGEVYAATSVGVKRLKDSALADAGLDSPAVSSLASSHGVLLVTTPGVGIMQSEDQGATWDLVKRLYHNRTYSARHWWHEGLS